MPFSMAGCVAFVLDRFYMNRVAAKGSVAAELVTLINALGMFNGGCTLDAVQQWKNTLIGSTVEEHS
jgi:hypothetical protein